MAPALLRSERGQASIELIGVLPMALLATLVAWQLAVAGHTLWLCAHAARVAARAEAVGGDPASAARSALPRALEQGMRVERRRAGGVRVTLELPLLPGRRAGPVAVSASSSFGGSR